MNFFSKTFISSIYKKFSWLLRSQRRAAAALRPLVQLVSVLVLALLLVCVPVAVVVGVVLSCQVLCLIAAVAALPWVLRALR